jgi:hypothetical protein
MKSTQLPVWVRYSLIAAIAVGLGLVSGIPDWKLPSPQDSTWHPLIGVGHAVIVGMVFALIVLAASYWSEERVQGRHRINYRRTVLVFLVFAAGDLVAEFSMRPLFSALSHHMRAERINAYLVRGGGGWLEPLMILALFAVVVFVRFRYRRH